MDSVLCNKCGKPMVSGFVGASRGIFWREQSQKPLRWEWLWKALPNTLAWWTFRENAAWHCADCQLLVVDHSHSLPAKRS